LSVGFGFSKLTFAGTRTNDADAPKPVLAVEPVTRRRIPGSGHDSLASLGYDGTGFPTQKSEGREKRRQWTEATRRPAASLAGARTGEASIE
jgi:hypothetical protein